MLLAGPMSHNREYYMDFVHIYNVLQDSSSVHFARFNDC